MKKTTIMRIASTLLIAVLLTTCAIGATFAKYTNFTTTTDSARVAEWGWGTTAITLDWFDFNYVTGEDTNVDGETENVIAPGTTKTATISFDPSSTFKPEVAYSLTFAVETEITDELEARLTWKLNETPYDTLAELEAAIEGLSVARVAPNTASPIDFTITWDWAFETDNAADTALGEVGADEVSITIKLTADQLD